MDPVGQEVTSSYNPPEADFSHPTNQEAQIFAEKAGVPSTQSREEKKKPKHQQLFQPGLLRTLDLRHFLPEPEWFPSSYTHAPPNAGY